MSPSPKSAHLRDRTALSRSATPAGSRTGLRNGLRHSNIESRVGVIEEGPGDHETGDRDVAGAEEIVKSAPENAANRLTPTPKNSNVAERRSNRNLTPLRTSSRLNTPDVNSSVVDRGQNSGSPRLVPPRISAEPQSSPASTSAPPSSNTPVPEAGSPTTSPDNDTTLLDDVTEPLPLATPQNTSSTVKSSERQSPAGQSPVAESSQSARQQPAPSSHSSGGGRPPVRIDTRAGIENYFKPTQSAQIVSSPATLATAQTPGRPSDIASAQELPKRATRISSGALQKKSVSEILGEPQKTILPQVDSPLSSAGSDMSPMSVQFRRIDREKERSKLSTVVFAKPARSSDASDTIEIARKPPDAAVDSPPKERDYLYSLFESRAYAPPKNAALSTLIHEARKTISTADHVIDYREQMNCRAMKRIYQLQNANRWPLRQLKRAEEVVRPTSHWDFILDHVRWMRTDFREERKWKLAAASAFADACAEWVVSGLTERKLLQVHVRPPTILPLSAVEDVEMAEATQSPTQPTPELVPSSEDDSIIDETVSDPRDILGNNGPAAIFSLGPRELCFNIENNVTTAKLLDELPLYRPTVTEPDTFKSDLAERLDAKWKQEIVPVSRWATETLRRLDPKPPAKRSRYTYEQEGSPRKDTVPLPPRQTDVALFQPENKHMRDRIHPGQSFRPPTEHPMPTQAFFESRHSSQWTQAEDDELRRLVKDYSYNWSLISACLTSKSLFSSGADRRTPWECFERWIGLEGLPADMSKTPYFRTYHSRLEAASRHVQAQMEAAQARAGAAGQPLRKRTNQPVRVERKRTQKHLAMLDAMRKLAKKRETAAQKAQHQAELAAMRKNHEVNQPKPPISKPSEFSRLKHERELKMAEKQEAYRQQLLAQQQVVARQRAQGGPVPGVPNGVPRGMNGLPNGPMPAGMAGIPNGSLAVPGTARPHPGFPGMVNGMPNGAPFPPGMMGPKSAQHAAQMQLMAAARIGSSPENQRRILEQVAQVQQQQLMAQQMARQNGGQPGTHSSPNLANAALANGNGIPHAAYMAALAAANNGANTGPHPDGLSRSPRNQAVLPGMGQSLSNGQMPLITLISNQIRQQQPQWNDEQIIQAATQQLKIYSAQAQQNANAVAAPNNQKQRTLNQAALNAAMGAANAGAHASALAAASYNQGQAMMTNEQVQQYNARMRQQQAVQRAAGPGNGYPTNGMGPHGMMPTLGTSPVLNMARPVSQHSQQSANGQPLQGQAHGPMSRSATPRDQRSNSGGGGTNGGPGMMAQSASPIQQQQSAT